MFFKITQSRILFKNLIKKNVAKNIFGFISRLFKAKKEETVANFTIQNFMFNREHV